MQNIRKRIMFFGTIFVLFFLMMLVLLFAHQKNSTEHTREIENPKAITLDRTHLSEFLQDTLEEFFPFQTLQADINEDGVFCLSASITKEELKKLLQQYNLPLQHAFLFLSDPIPVELSFRLESDKEHLSVFLLTFEVAEIDLTGLLLNTRLFDSISNAANERLKMQNSKILSFQTIPGGFSIQFRQ